MWDIITQLMIVGPSLVHLQYLVDAGKGSVHHPSLITLEKMVVSSLLEGQG